MGHMAQFVKHNQLCTLDVPHEAMGVVQRNEPVFSAPHQGVLYAAVGAVDVKAHKAGCVVPYRADASRLTSGVEVQMHVLFAPS